MFGMVSVSSRRSRPKRPSTSGSYSVAAMRIPELPIPAFLPLAFTRGHDSAPFRHTKHGPLLLSCCLDNLPSFTLMNSPAVVFQVFPVCLSLSVVLSCYLCPYPCHVPLHPWVRLSVCSFTSMPGLGMLVSLSVCSFLRETDIRMRTRCVLLREYRTLRQGQSFQHRLPFRITVVCVGAAFTIV